MIFPALTKKLSVSRNNLITRGNSSVDICCIYVCDNHSRYLHIAAIMAMRILVGTSAGFSAIAAIRNFFHFAYNGSGIAGFIASHNMGFARRCPAVSCLPCMVDYTLHTRVSGRSEVRSQQR